MNIYTKTILSATVITALAITATEFSNPALGNATGAPVSRTGSPFDAGNCTGCHAGTPATLPGLITSNIPASGYIPGSTYTITATVSVAGINKYGFEISPQSNTGALRGTMIITDAVQTKLLTGNKYITHKSTGTAGTGTKTWTFNWTAPAAGSGDVTFYGAFVAANGNGANTGDQVKLSSTLVQENLSASVAENGVDESWSVYPNPAADQLFLTSSENAAMEEITIYDITGKQIRIIRSHELSQDKSIDITDLQSGLYVLTIRSDKGLSSVKFMKR